MWLWRTGCARDAPQPPCTPHRHALLRLTVPLTTCHPHRALALPVPLLHAQALVGRVADLARLPVGQVSGMQLVQLGLEQEQAAAVVARHATLASLAHELAVARAQPAFPAVAAAAAPRTAAATTARERQRALGQPAAALQRIIEQGGAWAPTGVCLAAAAVLLEQDCAATRGR